MYVFVYIIAEAVAEDTGASLEVCVCVCDMCMYVSIYYCGV